MLCYIYCLMLLAAVVPGVQEIAGDAAKFEQLPPVASRRPIGRGGAGRK